MRLLSGLAGSIHNAFRSTQAISEPSPLAWIPMNFDGLVRFAAENERSGTDKSSTPWQLVHFFSKKVFTHEMSTPGPASAMPEPPEPPAPPLPPAMVVVGFSFRKLSFSVWVSSPAQPLPAKTEATKRSGMENRPK